MSSRKRKLSFLEEEVIPLHSDQDDDQTEKKMDTNAYGTPLRIFAWLCDPEGANLAIKGDACASKENALHTNYLTEKDNSMNIGWTKHFKVNTCCAAFENGKPIEYIFFNPPYGRDKYGNKLNDWFRKAHTEACQGTGIVMLVPAPNGEVDRWGKYVYGKATKVYDVQGRIRFRSPLNGKLMKNPANFGCFIVIWDPRALCEKHRPSPTVSTVIGPFYQA